LSIFISSNPVTFCNQSTQIVIDTDGNAKLKTVIVWRYDVSLIVIAECCDYVRVLVLIDTILTANIVGKYVICKKICDNFISAHNLEIRGTENHPV
jgi:hypothetical protein